MRGVALMSLRYIGPGFMPRTLSYGSHVTAQHTPRSPADAVPGSWVLRAPPWARPFLQLSRYDRPAGFWLLALPCLIALALSRAGQGFSADDGGLALLFVAGAVAMRGAGCTWNDIVDRKIDARVTRTAQRPLPSGAVSLRSAGIWLLAQCAVGLGVLFCLPEIARWVALGSVPLVALYPLMKRITWWPQVWLGLTFNWGVLVAAAATRGFIGLPDYLLYAGLVFWTLGYDTIYAVQDLEDDALVGVRSSARRLGSALRPAVAVIYLGSIVLCSAAGYIVSGLIGILMALPFSLHLMQQAMRADPARPSRALSLFRTNRDAGILLLAGWAFIATT